MISDARGPIGDRSVPKFQVVKTLRFVQAVQLDSSWFNVQQFNFQRKRETSTFENFAFYRINNISSLGYCGSGIPSWRQILRARGDPRFLYVLEPW